MIVEYKQAMVTARDPANQKVVGRVTGKTVQASFFQLTRNANWLGDRVLLHESYPTAAIAFPANRKIFRVEAGDLIVPQYDPYGLAGRVFRVSRIEEESPTSERINVFAAEDVHYLSRTVDVVPSAGKGGRRDLTIESLDHAAAMEAPYWITPDQARMVTMAARKTGNETGYIVLLSFDGSSYTHADVVTTFTPYGTLSGAYPETIMVDDQVGFEVDFVTEDLSPIQSISRAELFAGRNMAMLGDELISFQTFTPVSENRYKVEGIVRGMYDTERTAHEAGAPFWYLGLSRFGLVENTNFQIGATRHLKFNPYNLFKSGSEEDAVPIEHVISGRAMKHLRPSNFFANGARRRPVYEGDIVLTWAPRSRTGGAGHGLADVVTDTDPATGFEGLFRLEVYAEESLVRTEDNVDALTWTYTEAMNLADNSTLPGRVDFKLYAKRTFGGATLLSAPAEASALLA